jgi:DME family drug/metabolite transporter
MATTISAPPGSRRLRVLAGFLFALGAGTLWGTTGPLSTALYSEGAELTAVGFWRILLATLGFIVYGLFAPGLFRMDRRGLVLVGLVGGALVALFEVAYQFAIQGVGVAGAATLLYTAPIMVAVLAHPLLGERLTLPRVVLAVVVLVGVALTVSGHVTGDEAEAAEGASRAAGIAGGLLSAAGFAGSTLLARWAVPRYGAVRVLFYEIAGGTVILGVLLPLVGETPIPPGTLAGWVYIASLGLGAVLGANFCYFAAVRRIDAAPTAVAASIEPVVGALLALLLFQQYLTASGWLGLFLVVGGVAAGYWREALSGSTERVPGAAPAPPG